MNRREFIRSAAALAAVPAVAGNTFGAEKSEGRILFGSCVWGGVEGAAAIKRAGFDFVEFAVEPALNPDKDAEWWKGQRDKLLAMPLPLRSCNGFLPGRFRLTGPKADHAPALAYAETALRRAEEVGVRTVVFGSGGARNVPGDFTGPRDKWPDVQKGRDQYADFCRELAKRVADLKTVQVVIEPLCPNESNIINYVWQGVQICEEVNSPRLAQLADLFHMMMGRESAASIVAAGKWLKHCHIASFATRNFPGAEPETVSRFKPYFDALKAIGYTGGVSCECGWGKGEDYEKNLETALKCLRRL